MEYDIKRNGRYRRKTNTEMYIGQYAGQTRKDGHSKLHSVEDGAKVTEDRTRHALSATYDYTNVPGWNLNGKQKGC